MHYIDNRIEHVFHIYAFALTPQFCSKLRLQTYNPCKKSYPVRIFLYCKETENALFNKRPRQWHKSIETGTSNLIKIWVSQHPGIASRDDGLFSGESLHQDIFMANQREGIRTLLDADFAPKYRIAPANCTLVSEDD